MIGSHSQSLGLFSHKCWTQFFPPISEEDSVFDESDVHDTPTGAANKESQTFFARLKRIGGSKSVKYQPVELNARKSKSNHCVLFTTWTEAFPWRLYEISASLSFDNFSFFPCS